MKTQRSTTHRLPAACRKAALATICLLTPLVVSAQSGPFALHSGDRVVFYGDSITEQQLYTRFIELYALTRFPSSNINFIMSGVSGDKVSGGAGGPVDLRLPRDVFNEKPTVVTIMLGMNDGYYRPFEVGIMRTYELGYAHILDEIAAHAPQARILVLRPSAYDEITQPGKGIPGYNSFLIQMGDSIARMAAERHLAVVDLDAPMVDALTKARANDPTLATLLIADHVHPGPGMHWVMADAVLKSWNATPTVADVSIDGAHGAVLKAGTSEITSLKHTAHSITWTQKDQSLPLPLASSETDPLLALALRSSSVIDDLDREMLTVGSLPTGRYQLRIDAVSVGAFSNDVLAHGVNLARLDTPMLRQANAVYLANDGKITLDLRRNYQLRNTPSPANTQTLTAVEAALRIADENQHPQAQPVAHTYTLEPAQ